MPIEKRLLFLFSIHAILETIVKVNKAHELAIITNSDHFSVEPKDQTLKIRINITKLKMLLVKKNFIRIIRL